MKGSISRQTSTTIGHQCGNESRCNRQDCKHLERKSGNHTMIEIMSIGDFDSLMERECDLSILIKQIVQGLMSCPSVFYVSLV